MEFAELKKQYQSETEPKKKLELLKSLLVLAIDENSPEINSLIQDLISLHPEEINLSETIVCSSCGSTTVPHKVIKFPPRAEVHFRICPNCKKVKEFAYLSPVSKKVVMLSDVLINDSLPRLKDYVGKLMDDRRVDEALAFLDGVAKSASNREVVAYAHTFISEELMDQKKIDEALPHVERLIELYTKSHDNKKLSQILQKYVYIQLLKSNPEKALEALNDLLRLSRDIKDVRLEIASLINIGIAREQQGNYEEAVESLADAMNLAEAKNIDDLFEQASYRTREMLRRIQERDQGGA